MMIFSTATVSQRGQPRSLLLLILLSWLPMVGALAFITFYFVAYQKAGHDPHNGNIIPSAEAGHEHIYSISNLIYFYMPFLIITWGVSLVRARVRGLRLGWLNICAFLLGWALYFIIFRMDPDYSNWFMY